MRVANVEDIFESCGRMLCRQPDRKVVVTYPHKEKGGCFLQKCAFIYKSIHLTFQRGRLALAMVVDSGEVQ